MESNDPIEPNTSQYQINKREAKLRDQQERLDLLFKADKLLPKKSIDKELEKFQLYSGKEISLQEIDLIVSKAANSYSPMFPNSKPFFKLMYGLLGWDHLDPTKFQKPPCVALYIKQYIYARFDNRILPTLLRRDNPYITGHIRKYKLFQFLNPKGLDMMEEFIEEAMSVMKEAKDWRDFELKYAKKFYLSIQLKISDVGLD